MKFREVVEVGHGYTGEERTGDVRGEDVEFGSLLLSPPVLTGLTRSAFKRPSPVQLAAIPIGKLGLDMIVQAKSGTGKTCVFVVLGLETVTLTNHSPQVLVLAPTREIAQQIYQCFLSVGRCMVNDGLKIGLFIGGTQMGKDRKILKDGCQIVVGSPGRLCQLINDNQLQLDSIRLLVLDEADKLMEDSFQQNVNWMFSQMPSSKQVGVFSATYPNVLHDFLSKYMESPTMLRLDEFDVQLLGIKQYLAELPPLSQGRNSPEFDADAVVKTKVAALLELLRRVRYNQCVVFCNYQDKAECVWKLLDEAGEKAQFISAQLDQEKRAEVISLLKRNKCRLLVSTDLTARGIDVPNINLVVNLETPGDPETYFHRIGRAGRFGGYGAAVTIVVDNVDSRRFFAIGSIGNFNTKQLPALKGYGAAVTIVVDNVDSRRFFAIGSIGNFNTKQLPALKGYGAAVTIVVDNVDSRRFFAIGSIGNFNTKQLPALKGYGAAVTIVVDNVDSRRFFAIGSIGNFNTKQLPALKGYGAAVTIVVDNVDSRRFFAIGSIGNFNTKQLPALKGYGAAVTIVVDNVDSRRFFAIGSIGNFNTKQLPALKGYGAAVTIVVDNVDSRRFFAIGSIGNFNTKQLPALKGYGAAVTIVVDNVDSRRFFAIGSIGNFNTKQLPALKGYGAAVTIVVDNVDSRRFFAIGSIGNFNTKQLPALKGYGAAVTIVVDNVDSRRFFAIGSIGNFNTKQLPALKGYGAAVTIVVDNVDSRRFFAIGSIGNFNTKQLPALKGYGAAVTIVVDNVDSRRFFAIGSIGNFNTKQLPALKGYGAAVTIVVDNVDSRRFFAIGSIGNFNTKQLPALKGYGAAVTIVVDNVDSRRFFAIGSIGNFNTKQLPALKEVPGDLCSDMSFWEQQPRVKFPDKEENARPLRNHYSLLAKEGAEDVVAVGQERRQKHEPYSDSCRPRPDPERADPAEFAANRGWEGLFDAVRLSEPSSKPDSLLSYDRREMLDICALVLARVSGQERRREPSPAPQGDDPFAPLSLDDITDGSCLAPASAQFSTRRNGSDPFAPVDFDAESAPEFGISTRQIAKAKRKGGGVAGRIVRSAAQSPLNSSLDDTPIISSPDIGLSPLSNLTLEEEQAEENSVVDQAQVSTAEDEPAVQGEDALLSEPPPPLFVPSPPSPTRPSPPAIFPTSAPVEKALPSPPDLNKESTLEMDTKESLSVSTAADLDSSSELLFYGRRKESVKKPPKDKPSRVAEGRRTYDSATMRALRAKSAAYRYTKEELMREWHDVSPTKLRLLALSKWPLVNNFPFLADPDSRCSLDRPNNIPNPTPAELAALARRAQRSEQGGQELGPRLSEVRAAVQKRKGRLSPVPQNPEPRHNSGLPLRPGHYDQALASLQDFRTRYHQDPHSVVASHGPLVAPRVNGAEWRGQWEGVRAMMEEADAAIATTLRLPRPAQPHPVARSRVGYDKEALLTLWESAVRRNEAEKGSGAFWDSDWYRQVQASGAFFDHHVRPPTPPEEPRVEKKAPVSPSPPPLPVASTVNAEAAYLAALGEYREVLGEWRRGASLSNAQSQALYLRHMSAPFPAL